MNNLIQNKKGISLLLILLMLTSILTITLGAASLVFLSTKSAGTQLQSTKAYFAAEAGAERALWEARKNFFSFGDAQESIWNASLSIGVLYDVDYEKDATSVSFISLGSSGQTRRSVSAKFNFAGS